MILIVMIALVADDELVNVLLREETVRRTSFWRQLRKKIRTRACSGCQRLVEVKLVNGGHFYGN